MFRKIITCLFCLLAAGRLTAQTARTGNSSEILMQLKKLNVFGSVLYIAAHPDDENTRLLAYLANEKLVRTGYLSLTRGDGGQNLIGSEQGIELGLIRTQELMAARRTDGAEQFFTRAYDFGFSKTSEETFRIWGKEKILADVVWVVRNFKPDVIIARFPEDTRAGHGHHAASGILAREAFYAAADKNRFPEQLSQGVSTWQAKRVLWNTFNFGGNNTQSEDQYKLNIGLYNPLLGKSYGEIAAESRSQHKSQGFGVPSSRGEQIEYFTTIGGDKPVNDLLDGTDISWNRVAPQQAGAPAQEDNIPQLVNTIIKEFDVTHPENSIPQLARLYKKIETVGDAWWKQHKLKEVQQIMAACAGFYAEATTGTAYAVKGDSLRINFSVNTRLAENVQLLYTRYRDLNITNNRELVKNKNMNYFETIPVKTDWPLTQPYWLEHKMDNGTFHVDDQQMIGRADGPYENVQFGVRLAGIDLVFERQLQYKSTDPVKGERFQPVYIVPAADLAIAPNVVVNTPGRSNSYDAIITSRMARPKGRFTLTGSVKCDTVYRDLVIEDSLVKGKKVQYTINKHSWKEGGCPGGITYFLHDISGRDIVSSKTLRTIQYDHIPHIAYTQNPQVNIIYPNLKASKKRVGYINGAGDKTADALVQLGYEVSFLEEKDIKPGLRNRFDAIVTGVRAYNTNDWMNNVHDHLMQFVKDGGNLLVQYNTSNQIGPVKAKIAPYPFTISRNRVTEEQAAVRFILPAHPLLNTPNKISNSDFEGWVQERSVYDATQADSAYKKIISMNDTGEPANEGALITAPYGKGNFTYCSLALFRQLPAGVPGAYRLLVNLVEQPANK
ncbi:MAG: PIG-L family deacetylase [Dinghuibacter sp.]|nr:PIG-L family deacetylase [Dinghuibacter sp.]